MTPPFGDGAKARPPAAEEEGGGGRCPYCHATVALEGRVWVACERCLARHHRACWQERGGCGSCGRERGLSPDGPRAGMRLERWSRRASSRDGLALLLTALTLAALAAGIAYEAGRLRERTHREDPRTQQAAALAARALAVRTCQDVLGQAGRDELAARLVMFHGASQRFRSALLRDLARMLTALDPDVPEEARLKRILDEQLPRALMAVEVEVEERG